MHIGKNQIILYYALLDLLNPISLIIQALFIFANSDHLYGVSSSYGLLMIKLKLRRKQSELSSSFTTTLCSRMCVVQLSCRDVKDCSRPSTCKYCQKPNHQIGFMGLKLCHLKFRLQLYSLLVNQTSSNSSYEYAFPLLFLYQ